VRILVTNDDGIDSIGLHVLARAMCRHGDVVVAAPDREYSGAGAALGALHLLQPEVRRVELDGVPEAWTVNGPPGLCVMFSRLGAFGERFDLVVSGINPGANVGRAVYHSGTVGACLTGRNGGISGVAVSQAVTGFGVEGQGWDEMIADQHWEAAAEVASTFVGALVADLPAEPVVVNLNVPNLPVADMKGWREAEIGTVPPRTMASAVLEPIAGHEDAFHVRMQWGDEVTLPEGTDGGTVERGEVAVTYLSRLTAERRDDLGGPERALDELLG
jgi:5'-nucleotidase